MTPANDQMHPATITDKVYRQLRWDILNGVFPPGSHLVKRTLAKKYGASVPPVAEACLRLESEGMVESFPLLGTFVAEAFPDDFADEIALREAIETQIARVYALRATEKEKDRLEKLAERLDEFQAAHDREDTESARQLQRMHTEFHLTLAKMSKAALLYREMKSLWLRRLLLIWSVGDPRFPEPKSWHSQLALALNSGDPEMADQAMRLHVTLYMEERTEDILKENYARHEQSLETLLLDQDPAESARYRDGEEM